MSYHWKFKPYHTIECKDKIKINVHLFKNNHFHSRSGFFCHLENVQFRQPCIKNSIDIAIIINIRYMGDFLITVPFKFAFLHFDFVSLKSFLIFLGKKKYFNSEQSKWLVKLMIIFFLSPVACHICGALSLCHIKISVIRTLHCCGFPAITPIVGITWPCAELIISIRLLRAVWKTSIGCYGIWYCKPLGAGSVVWIGLCSPNQVDWTFTLLYQSFTVATNKIFVESSWVAKETIRWYSTFSCLCGSTSV